MEVASPGIALLLSVSALGFPTVMVGDVRCGCLFLSPDCDLVLEGSQRDLPWRPTEDTLELSNVDRQPPSWSLFMGLQVKRLALCLDFLAAEREMQCVFTCL